MVGVDDAIDSPDRDSQNNCLDTGRRWVYTACAVRVSPACASAPAFRSGRFVPGPPQDLSRPAVCTRQKTRSLGPKLAVIPAQNLEGRPPGGQFVPGLRNMLIGDMQGSYLQAAAGSGARVSRFQVQRGIGNPREDRANTGRC